MALARHPSEESLFIRLSINLTGFADCCVSLPLSGISHIEAGQGCPSAVRVAEYRLAWVDRGVWGQIAPLSARCLHLGFETVSEMATGRRGSRFSQLGIALLDCAEVSIGPSLFSVGLL